MSGVLIKDGLLIDPATNTEAPTDIFIKNGVIAARGAPGTLQGTAAAQIFSAKGKWIVPGFIDLHVHLREPGYEWKETIRTGAEAAVLGGYTTVCCMPNTKPINDHAEVTRFILQRACDAARARVLPIGAISREEKGRELAPLSELQEAGCVAFSDDGEPVYDAGLMRRALEWGKMIRATLCCHEEDKCLSAGGSMNESPRSYRLGLKGWPKVAEEVMIARDIELARTTGARTHFCHVSTARGVELIRRAKADGIPVSAEVTPHHLTLTEDMVEGYNTFAKMSPPLREAEDVAALRAGLRDGTIDAIASDHAPHEDDSKRVEFSQATFGILGLQTALPLLLQLIDEGAISRMRAIEVCTIGPARAFGLPYGTLAEGSSADVSIIDPLQEWSFTRNEIRSLSCNTPFLDRPLRGRAEVVLVGGNVVVRNGALV